MTIKQWSWDEGRTPTKNSECSTTQVMPAGQGVLRGSYLVPETSVYETASLQGENTSCGGLETVSIGKMSATQNISI